MEHSLYTYVYRNYRLVDLPWDSVFTWYFAALFVDFCYYWGHRASHGRNVSAQPVASSTNIQICSPAVEINILWAHHQSHHSAETYTLVNTFRLPFTQDWLYAVSIKLVYLFTLNVEYK